MSSLNVGFSYDGDARSESVANPIRSRSKEMTDTTIVGNGGGGEFDYDTAGAVKGTTASAAGKKIHVTPKTLAGPRGSKTIHPKAGGQPITTNLKASSKPTSASSSVQDFYDAKSTRLIGSLQKPDDAHNSAKVQNMDPRSFQNESKASGGYTTPMQTVIDSRAQTGSVANATLRIVKHGSERYDPVGKSTNDRTTLFTTPPPKGDQSRHFASGGEIRDTQPLVGNTQTRAQFFNIGTEDEDRARLENEREKWRQVSFA